MQMFNFRLLIMKCSSLCLTDVLMLLHRNSPDVRPGVPMVKRQKEAIKKEALHKEKNAQNRQKSYREQEKESRESALQSSISSQNKGFALLQKMGYKAGQGLGKQGQTFRLLNGLFCVQKTHTLLFCKICNVF